MKAKPIEEGARVFVSHSPNHPDLLGRYGVVRNKAGIYTSVYGTDDLYWVVELSDEFIDARTEDLTRIDDPDIEKQLKKEREKEHA